MLTKSDLTQIRKIVREEVGNETQALKNELQSDISMARIRVQNDINELKDRIKNLEIRVTKMHEELKNEIKLVANFLDKENVKAIKRVERIEEYLKLSPAA